MPKHTPEPWKVTIGGTDSWQLATFGADGTSKIYLQGPKCERELVGTSHEDALRVESCVNACANIGNPRDIPELIKRVRRLDETMAALDVKTASVLVGNRIISEIFSIKRILAKMGGECL